MAALGTEAIIFDCIGVLYKSSNYPFRGQELNTELVNFIKNNLKPGYRIGLLSNIDRDWIDKFVSKHHLEKLFDAIVVSGDEGVAKPNPAIYHRISMALGVQPDACIMIDDMQENCKGAERAGMQSILFTSNKMLFDDFIKYGFIPEKH